MVADLIIHPFIEIKDLMSFDNNNSVISGVKTDLIIDTCNAGAGQLAVTMDGPSRVAMDCTEVEEGYKVCKCLL